MNRKRRAIRKQRRRRHEKRELQRFVAGAAAVFAANLGEPLMTFLSGGSPAAPRALQEKP